MLLNKVAPQTLKGILMSLGLAAFLACAGFAHAEEPVDAPKESMFQAGKSYFSRASDRLVDSVSEKSESLINQAMSVIGVRYRWNAELPSLVWMAVVLSPMSLKISWDFCFPISQPK